MNALALADVNQHLLDRVHFMDALTLTYLLPDESVDCFITSPPYDNLRQYGGHTAFNFPELARQMYRSLKLGGVVAWIVKDQVIGGSESLTSFEQSLMARETGFRQHDTMIWDKGEKTTFPDPTRYTQAFEFMFIWSKGKPKTTCIQQKQNKHAGHAPATEKLHLTPEGSRKVISAEPIKELGPMSNVWHINTGYNHTTKDDYFIFEHDAPFPEELAKRHILTWTGPGDLVVDPFGGSGTTAKMALLTGRHWISGDINSDYVEMARKRIALTRDRIREGLEQIRNADPYQKTTIEVGGEGEDKITVTQASLFQEES